MSVSKELKSRLEELEMRDWNLPVIKTRFNKLVQKGIPLKKISREEMICQKRDILDRVQSRAEEYCYLTRNCAKGSTLALLEEFGLGNMEIIRALAPFPGIGMSGGICGPVTGGLIALGLYFSNEDLADFKDVKAYMAARTFLQRFEETFGSLLCPNVQKFIVGEYYDPLASFENLKNFEKAKGREKCPLAPGWGARIAAEIIIGGMENQTSA